MATERQAAIDRLALYNELFGNLLSLLDTGGRPSSASQKEDARRLLRELKDQLKEEIGSLKKRRESLNRFERDFLEPALFETSADIKTRVNTAPGPAWYSDLYNARINIKHMLSQLEAD